MYPTSLVVGILLFHTAFPFVHTFQSLIFTNSFWTKHFHFLFKNSWGHYQQFREHTYAHLHIHTHSLPDQLSQQQEGDVSLHQMWPTFLAAWRRQDGTTDSETCPVSLKIYKVLASEITHYNNTELPMYALSNISLVLGHGDFQCMSGCIFMLQPLTPFYQIKIQVQDMILTTVVIN